MSWAAAGIAATAALLQFALNGGEPPAPASLTLPLPLSLLLLFGVAWAVMLEEVFWIFRTPGEWAGRSWREIVGLGLWFVITTAAVATWPYDRGFINVGLVGRKAPPPLLVSMFFLQTVIGMTPAALLMRWRRPDWAGRYVHLMGWLGLTFTLAILFGHYIAFLDRFGNNPDFYYYTCYARDTVALGKAHLSQYAYFPGPYYFWEWVLRATDGSLRSLQISALLVVLASSALTGFVVWRVAQSGLAGVFAAAMHLGLAQRFQSFGGLTEPLATLPFLGAMAVWGGQPFYGRRGAARAVMYGILLGLTAVCKQQAGLLTLGFAVLPAQKLLRPRAERHQWRLLILVPIVAVVTLLVAVLLRGEGLVPLKMGLKAAAGGTPMPGAENQITNVLGLFRRFFLISTIANLLVFGTVVSEALIRVYRNGRSSTDAGLVDVWRVALLSFLATLIQFRWKPYPHYGMLSMPCLVIVSVLSAVRLYRQVMRVRPLAPAEQWLWGSLFSLPLLIACTSALATRMDPKATGPRGPWHLSRHAQEIIAACRPFVTPGQDVLVIPRGLNALHFALGTRAMSDPEGYAYLNPPERISRVIGLAHGPNVVLHYYGKQNFLEDPEELGWIDELLKSSGFRPQAVTDDCKVWLRE